MLKKILSVVILSGVLFQPAAHAASAVEYGLLKSLLELNGAENDAVTDTSLRSVCIHAMGGKYISLDVDEVVPNVPTLSFPFKIHFCLVDDGAEVNANAFDKICENKLKYTNINVPTVGVYICSDSAGDEPL